MSNFLLYLFLSKSLFFFRTEASEFEFFKAKCDSNCTFEGYPLNSENLNLFPSNCSSVCSYLVIDGSSEVTESQLSMVFRNMRTLSGFLTITKTNFTSVRFLEGLESIECEPDDYLTIEWNYELLEYGLTSLSSTSCNLIFINNPNVTRLSIPNLKNFYTPNPDNSPLIFSIYNTAKGFCMTLQEATNFVSSTSMKTGTVRVRYCNLSSNIIDNEKVCEMGNFNRIKNLDPTCKRIFGNVQILAGDEEYVNYLKSVTWVYGTILIKGTNLTRIDFFDSLQYVVIFSEDQGLINIRDNPNLINATFPQVKLISGDLQYPLVFLYNNIKLGQDFQTCIRIRNELNSTSSSTPFVDRRTCERISTSEDTLPEYGFAFFRDKCDSTCTFPHDHVSSESLAYFPKNCTAVCSYLLIDESSEVTEEQLTEVFKNMRTLYGSLRIRKTMFTSAKFLDGLEKIECDSGDSIEFLSNDGMTDIGMTKLEATSCGIFIETNLNLTRLNLPMLKNFCYSSPCQPPIKFQITGHADNFCIRIDEATNLLASDSTRIQTISSAFCNISESYTSMFQDKLCKFKNFELSTFDTNCTKIFGNVVVRAGDEQYVKKLKSVTWIYGEVLVEGTSLTKIDFFDSLQYVASFNVSGYHNQKRLILIKDNPNMIAKLDDHLQKITAFGEKYFMIQENHPQLGKDYRNCMRIKESLNGSVWDVPTIDGKSCRQILEVYGDNSTVNGRIGSVFIIVSLLLTFLTN